MFSKFSIVLYVVIILFSLGGCSNKKDKAFVQSMLQTNGAAAVREHTEKLKESILNYYIKLNKRNPSFYSKKNFKLIKKEIQNSTDNVVLPLLANKKNTSYKDYLNIALSEKYVKDRNDYLISGIYKMIYWAYDIKRLHTLTTIQYDTKKIQEANKMMQVIQYRIKTEKDKEGKYLFLTWQRAWQVDLINKRSKSDKVDLSNYSKKELLYSSNMSYQVISSNMIFTIQESLRYLGAEATNLSAQAIKSVFMFL